jgi:hypothetical protein
MLAGCIPLFARFAYIFVKSCGALHTHPCFRAQLNESAQRLGTQLTGPQREASEPGEFQSGLSQALTPGSDASTILYRIQVSQHGPQAHSSRRNLPFNAVMKTKDLANHRRVFIPYCGPIPPPLQAPGHCRFAVGGTRPKMRPLCDDGFLAQRKIRGPSI